MNFTFTSEQEAIGVAVLKLCAGFGDDYWLEKDRTDVWPADFYKAMADAGWLGIAMPQEYGGSGLGITEAAIMMQALGESGGGMGAIAAVQTSIGCMNPLAAYATPEQKRRMLPPLMQGKDMICFAVTEPDTGLEILKLNTRAVRDKDHYIISGRKTWISSAQVADRMLVLARTTPLADVKQPTEGLTLFHAAFDRKHITAEVIEKMGHGAVDSNLVTINDLPVPVSDRIGDEGKGYETILYGLNAERILIAAGAIGIGKAALARAATYARQRVVFDRPIGKNQSIQHPLAECWMEMQAANLMVFRAASLYDEGKPCAAEANAAKYLAAESAFKTCTRAVMTHGGYGYAKEYHVERYLREIIGSRLAPVTPQMVKCFIAENVLGLPKSY